MQAPLALHSRMATRSGNIVWRFPEVLRMRKSRSISNAKLRLRGGVHQPARQRDRRRRSTSARWCASLYFRTVCRPRRIDLSTSFTLG